MEILRILSLFFTIAIPAYFSITIKHFFYTITNVFLIIPFIDKLFYFLFHNTLRITALLKFLAWAAGSFSLIIGIYFYQYFWGNFEYNYEYYVLLIVSAAVIINFLDVIIFAKIEHFENTLKSVEVLTKKMEFSKFTNAIFNNELSKKSQIYTAFLDIFLLKLFNGIIAMGIFNYAAFKLNFIQLKTNIVNITPTLYDCIKYTFSFIPFVKLDNNLIPFEGFVWDCINIGFGISIFLWLLFFITAAPSYFKDYYDYDDNEEDDDDSDYDEEEN